MKIIELKYKTKKAFRKSLGVLTSPLVPISKMIQKQQDKTYKRKKDHATIKDYKKLVSKLMKRTYEYQYGAHSRGKYCTEYIVLGSRYRTSDYKWDMSTTIIDFMKQDELRKFPFVYNKEHFEKFSELLEKEFTESENFKTKFDVTSDNKRVMTIEINK